MRDFTLSLCNFLTKRIKSHNRARFCFQAIFQASKFKNKNKYGGLKKGLKILNIIGSGVFEGFTFQKSSYSDVSDFLVKLFQSMSKDWPRVGNSHSHHGPAVSRFLVSNGSTNGAGCLRGLLRLIKTHFENISGCPF